MKSPAGNPTGDRICDGQVKGMTLRRHMAEEEEESVFFFLCHKPPQNSMAYNSIFSPTFGSGGV